MRKTLLTVLGLLLTTMSAFADLSYRNYRYDGYKVLPVKSNNIVFVGNSITDMHNWFEAFDNPNVISRGCSGAVASELIKNLEAILPGHPQKIFIMIGTNDLVAQGLNTHAQVAAKVRTALTRCSKESPESEIYVQSILPTKHNIHKVEDEIASNDSIKKICGEFKNTTYVDMWDDMQGILTGALTLDQLHLKASAYRIWCKKIAQYVGSECTYKDEYTDIFGGLGGVHGMRCSYFGMAPVKATDVLIIGDGAINGGEWNELLQCSNVKKRATGWGGCGTDMNTITAMLPAIFTGNGNKVAPKQILIEMGYQEASQKIAADSIARKYKIFLDKIRAYAPNTPIKLLAVYPSNTKDINTSYIVPFNAKLKELADSIDGIDFVGDTYTLLAKDDVANTAYFNSYYMYGMGQVKFAQAIAPYIEGATAITDEQAAANKARFEARTSLTTAMMTAASMPAGNGVGQYAPEALTSIAPGIDEGYALLANPETTNEEFTAKASTYTTLINEVLPKINMPLASTDAEEHWYQLYTPNRSNKYATSNGADQDLVGGDNTKLKNTMWKFVKRSDNTYDIVNRKDGTFVSPASSYNAALKTVDAQPAAGWTISYASAATTFIISSGKVQFNQTNKTGTPIYNWSQNQTGTDRNDTGCQYAIVDAPAPEDVEPVEIDSTCIQPYEISLQTGAFVSPTTGSANTSFPNGYIIAKAWQSTNDNPQIDFGCGSNNIMPSEIYQGDYLMLHPGKSGCDFTLKVTGTDCFISSYKFTYSSESAITITAGSQTFTASTTEQQAEVKDLQTTSTTINVAGTNAAGKGVILKDFVVNIYVPGSGVTAISPVTGLKGNAPVHYYDLQGRRVLNPTKGLYITNTGRKVLK